MMTFYCNAVSNWLNWTSWRTHKFILIIITNKYLNLKQKNTIHITWHHFQNSTNNLQNIIEKYALFYTLTSFIPYSHYIQIHNASTHNLIYKVDFFTKLYLQAITKLYKEFQQRNLYNILVLLNDKLNS